jgi:hypothetical protein
MADAAAKKIHTTRANAGRDSFPIADGVTVYEGMLAQLESGYLNHWDETGDFLGIVLGGDDRAFDGTLLGETSDTPDPEARVDTSGVVLMHLASVGGSPSQALVGAAVYCADSDTDSLTLTKTSGGRPVGTLIRYRSATDVDVQLFPSIVHQAIDVEAGVRVGSISETVNHDDMTDGGSTAGTYQMTDSVPAGAILLGSKVLVTEAFAGDGATTMTIGDGSDVDRYMTGTPSVATLAATGIETGVPSGSKLVTAANRPTITVTSNSDFTSVNAGQIVVTLYFLETV